MSEGDEPTPGPAGRDDAAAAQDAVTAAARRRRLAEVFGEVLPEQTNDDADPREGAGVGEEWLRRQVPPHHG